MKATKPLNQNNMKQTAVEFLEQQIRYYISNDDRLYDMFKQAKAMEKEQIKDAFVQCWKANIPDGIECKLDAEQYYKETYESNS